MVYFLLSRGIAQLVARLVWDEEAGGSNPPTPTSHEVRSKRMQFFAYILKCVNNTYYTGITNNLSRRVLQHTNGESLFTKTRLPVILVYYERLADRIKARKREVVIKDMSQRKKLDLINKFNLNQEKFTSSVNEKRD